MPWERPEAWDTTTLLRYRALVALRKALPALRRGGLRWVHVDGDSIVYLRESADESVLVLARRSGGDPLVLAGLPPTTRFENLYGGAKPLYTEPDGSTTVDGYGPTFQVWAINN
jgi:alpha-glucosidase